MLDNYEHDQRVGLISGFNHLKHWDCGDYSYCFTKTGATLGWGTWRRVWEQYDYYVRDIEEPYVCDLLSGAFSNRRYARRRIESWKSAARETMDRKVNYWDIQFGFLKYTQSFYCVVPKGNLIYNIGVGAGSTHTENNKAETWKKGKILFMPTEPMAFPLSHPDFVICDRRYDDEVFRIIFPGRVKRIFRKVKRVLGL